MSIKVGDKLPEATFMEMTADGPQPRTTEQVFGGKTIALFAVPQPVPHATCRASSTSPEI